MTAENCVKFIDFHAALVNINSNIEFIVSSTSHPTNLDLFTPRIQFGAFHRLFRSKNLISGDAEIFKFRWSAGMKCNRETQIQLFPAPDTSQWAMSRRNLISQYANVYSDFTIIMFPYPRCVPPSSAVSHKRPLEFQPPKPQSIIC